MNKFRVYATIEVEALDDMDAARKVFNVVSEYEHDDDDFVTVNVTRVEELIEEKE